MKVTVARQQKIAESIRGAAPMLRGFLQRECACGGKSGASGECEECCEKKLQRKSNDLALEMQEDSEVPPIVYDVLRSPGQPLDAGTRAFMEPRFGHDFSHVRVHSDTKAAESAHAVGALAYTVGRDVVFDAGQYAPHSSAGQRLLAHELMHTIQQQGHRPIPQERLILGSSTDPSEAAAEKVVDAVMDGARPHTSSVDTPVIQRQISSSQGGSQSGFRPRYYFYDRSNFGQRYDGEVDANNRRIILRMKLQFEPDPNLLSDPNAHNIIARFISEFQRIVRGQWANVYRLKSACEADSYSVDVHIDVNEPHPHWKVQIIRSSSASVASNVPTAVGSPAQLTEEANREKEKHPSGAPERSYGQVPSAHEFGHMIDLRDMPGAHGRNPMEWMDIMGLGSLVSPADYEPFKRIAECYGRDVKLSSTCNQWTTTGIT